MKTDPKVGLFVAKLNSKGEWIWAKSVSTGLFVASSSIAVDQKDNVLTVTTVSNSLKLATIDASWNSDPNLFRDLSLSKFDTKGKRLWTKRLGSNNVTSQGHSVASHEGNFFISYSLRAATLLRDQKFIQIGKDISVIAKMDETGEWVWTKQFKSTDRSISKGVAADSKGNVYVHGIFAGDITIGTETLSIRSPQQDSFITKLGNNGDVVWTRRAAYPKKELRRPCFADFISLNVTSRDHILISGSFQVKITLGAYELGDERFAQIPLEALFLTAMLDSEGNWLWAKTLDSSLGHHVGINTVIDPQDNLYTLGNFRFTFPLFPPQGSKKNISSGNDLDVFLIKMNWKSP